MPQDLQTLQTLMVDRTFKLVCKLYRREEVRLIKNRNRMTQSVTEVSGVSLITAKKRNSLTYLEQTNRASSTGSGKNMTLKKEIKALCMDLKSLR